MWLNGSLTPPNPACLPSNSFFPQTSWVSTLCPSSLLARTLPLIPRPAALPTRARLGVVAGDRLGTTDTVDQEPRRTSRPIAPFVGRSGGHDLGPRLRVRQDRARIIAQLLTDGVRLGLLGRRGQGRDLLLAERTRWQGWREKRKGQLFSCHRIHRRCPPPHSSSSFGGCFLFVYRIHYCN